MRMPSELHKLIDRLHDMGLRPHVVGGAVRDALLGLAPEDYDLALSGTPQTLEAIASLFPGSDRSGLPFGSLGIVLADGRRAELTLFRRESSYRDGRRPERVVFDASLEEDLARRDFVLNAMAWDPRTDRLVDPCGARLDLAAGRVAIRTVSEAKASFAADALRMIRAYRLLGRILHTRPACFHPDVSQALAQCADGMTRLTPFVMHRELNKIWREQTTGAVLAAMQHDGTLTPCYGPPGRRLAAGWHQALDARLQPAEKMALFSVLYGRTATALFPPQTGRRLRRKTVRLAERLAALDAGGRAEVLLGLRGLDEAGWAQLKRLAHRLPPDVANGRDVLEEAKPPLRESELAVGAADLRARGWPDADIGPALSELLSRVLAEGAPNDRKHLLHMLQKKGHHNG